MDIGNIPELSRRMEAVVGMVTPQTGTVADVGCDHAYVSIALVKRELCRRVIAMDVRTGPLQIARDNILNYGESERILLRQSDGLTGLAPGEADSVILAGMGGLLITRILKDGMEILTGEQAPALILQPQSDIREVRLFLYQNGYHIIREQMVFEDGKYYTVMLAERKTEVREASYTEIELLYGRCGLQGKNPVLFAYLEWEQGVLEKILEKLKRQEELAGKLPQRAGERKQMLKQQLIRNREASDCFLSEQGDQAGKCFS